MTPNDYERPYKPSFIDRFNDWVAQLPVRSWVFYVLFGIGLILLQTLFLWLDGGLYAQELLPVILFNGCATSFLVGLTHLLDSQALDALHSMRPALELTDSQFEDYAYRLSNMPPVTTVIAGLGMMVVAILAEMQSNALVRYAALERLPIFAVVFHLTDKGSAFVFGVVLFHSVRQLRLVDRINANHVRFSLFNLGPFRAFSRLTSSTAVGLVVCAYGWIPINPDLLTNPISLGFSGAVTILAVAVFVWPLLGAHRLMQTEKERVLHEIDLHFEAAFARIDRRFSVDDYSAYEGLNRTIASLEIQRSRIMAIPTWPWRPETARIVLTVVVLPLVLTIIQFFVLQALGR